MSLSKLALSISCAVCAGALTASAFATETDTIVNMPFSQLHWETTREGVGFAPLKGDRYSEAYMAMVRLPAGLVSPAHVKSATMYGLVVSGAIANVPVGANPGEEIALPAGSYYTIPAGLPHVSKCVSEVDCVTFLHQDGKFDFLPVER